MVRIRRGRSKLTGFLSCRNTASHRSARPCLRHGPRALPLGPPRPSGAPGQTSHLKTKPAYPRGMPDPRQARTLPSGGITRIRFLGRSQRLPLSNTLPISVETDVSYPSGGPPPEFPLIISPLPLLVNPLFPANLWGRDTLILQIFSFLFHSFETVLDSPFGKFYNIYAFYMLILCISSSFPL